MKNFAVSIILKAIDQVTAPVKGITGAVQRSMDNLQNSVQRAGKSMEKSMAFTRDIGIVGEVAKQVGDTIGDYGKGMLDAAGQMEGFQMTFENMLHGNKKKAMQVMKELTNFAAKTPYELPEVVQLGLQLQAIGKYSKTNLGMLGDLASAANKPLDQVARAFSKLVSGQKGESVEMFRDLLISTKDWVKYTGKGLDKKGSLIATTDEMVAALPKILKAKGFIGMMERKSQSWEGVNSNLSDTLLQLKALLGSFSLGPTKALSVWITGIVSSFQSWAKANPQLAKALSITILVIGGIATVVPSILLVIATIGALKASLVAGWAVAGPVGVVLLIIAAIAGLAILIIMNWKKIKKFFIGLWDGIIDKWTKIKGFFGEFWNGILNNKIVQGLLLCFAPIIGLPIVIIKNWSKIRGFFKKLWNGILNNKIVQGLLVCISPLIGLPVLIIKNWSKIKDFFRNLWSAIKEPFEKIGKALGISGNGGSIAKGAPVPTGAKAVNGTKTLNTNHNNHSTVDVNFNNMPHGTRVNSKNVGHGVNLRMGYNGVH